jgi:hypothetical protein
MGFGSLMFLKIRNLMFRLLLVNIVNYLTDDKDNDVTADQIYNADEMALLWRCLPPQHWLVKSRLQQVALSKIRTD